MVAPATPLVGRDEDLSELGAALARAVEGLRQLAVVVPDGGPGLLAGTDPLRGHLHAHSQDRRIARRGGGPAGHHPRDRFGGHAVVGAGHRHRRGRRPTPLLLALMFWQGAVYWTSPYMAWLHGLAQPAGAAHARTAAAEAHRGPAGPAGRGRALSVAGTTALAMVGTAFVLLLTLGSSHAGHPGNPFSLPAPSTSHQQPGRSGPDPGQHRAPPHSGTPSPTNTTTGPSSTTSTGPSSTSGSSTTAASSPTP